MSDQPTMRQVIDNYPNWRNTPEFRSIFDRLNAVVSEMPHFNNPINREYLAHDPQCCDRCRIEAILGTDAPTGDAT